jgi:CBS domain-containing protein
LISLQSYKEIYQWREQSINKVSFDHQKLNDFHDQIMEQIVQIALKKIESEWGPPPTRFAFFVMGSAGRSEQSVWSDQDHGIVYDSSTNDQQYFLRLGEEITKGLSIAGYELCDGNVMASNLQWCKSKMKWKNQLAYWLEKADWESLRFFSIFIDSRVLFGECDLLLELKNSAFLRIHQQPYLLKRLYDNVGFIKKGIGFFGQLLTEQSGEDTGTINLKQTIFFPYVNSLRLLALVENITSSSTLNRFNQLPNEYGKIKEYQADFLRLLNYRLYFQRLAQSYKKVHLLHVNSLSNREKQCVKEIMKKGHKLFFETKQMIEKRCTL